MSTDLQNRRIRLASRPHGEPVPSDFLHDNAPVPSPGPGEASLRTLHISLDPYVRGRMNDAKSYAAPMEVGDVIVGGTVSEVVESADDSLAPGDVVLGYGGWQEYSVEEVAGPRRLDPAAAPVTTALGVLGMPGFTAYAGLTAIGKVRPGRPSPSPRRRVPSAPRSRRSPACAVPARSRSPAASGRSRPLEELGVDVALDHRAPDLPGRLAAAAPDGIDVYFENVGGAVWDAVSLSLNEFARVPVCGLAANYNATSLPEGPDRSGALMGQVLAKSLTLRGFIQREFAPTMFEDFQREMSAWVTAGDVRYHEDVTVGLDRAPEAFVGMPRGDNLGKALITLS
ncbi:zinc-binding dehydrogenase [Brachybacterium sp. GPGPB12]|uniref:NADP-dependent oxidoreductase n=1 Tax=Brachybacterium sp. GPGPB12 TaxID=3023517 RepID=UPI0031346084